MTCPLGQYCLVGDPAAQPDPAQALPPTATPSPTPAPATDGGTGNWMVDQILGAVAKAVGDAASGFLQWLWNGVNDGTAVNLAAAPDRFLRLMGFTLALGLLIAFGAFLWEVASAAFHGGDLPRLGESLKGAVLATVGPAITLSVINLLLRASDQISSGIIDVGMAGSPGGVSTTLLGMVAVVNPMGVLGLGAVIIVIAFCQWVVLSLQASLIWIQVLILPLAFAGAPHPALRPLVGKWIGFTIGCIFIKPLLLLIVAIGMALMGATGATSPQHLGMGIAIMAVSVLAPFTALQLLTGLGEGFASAGSAGSRATHGANPMPKVSAVARTRFHLRRR